MKGFVITMTWAKPRTTVKAIIDSSTLGYYLSFNNLESNRKRQIQSNTGRVSLRLKANSRYEIKVLAYKVFDTSVAGPWSDLFTFKTNESGKCCSDNQNYALRPRPEDASPHVKGKCPQLIKSAGKSSEPNYVLV